MRVYLRSTKHWHVYKEEVKGDIPIDVPDNFDFGAEGFFCLHNYATDNNWENWLAQPQEARDIIQTVIDAYMLLH
jgi:hypothetical protein